MSKAFDACARSPSLLRSSAGGLRAEQVAGEVSRARRLLERLDQVALDKAFGRGLAAT